MTETEGDQSAAVVYGGRYAIEQELGHGGMGRVLRARDLKLERAVAIKVLQPGAPDGRRRARFEQEARAAGALDHPNIVVVHDVGEHKGEPYIVTELLEGRTLRKALARGPLPHSEALALASQLASGLAAAHAKGIVHRDLKPENLFVTREGRLKILDFGIAKLTEGVNRLHTESCDVIGTPAYMSPEQVRGRSADARSDVFSFGAVAQEMLAGAGPFDRETPAETGYAILHDAPAPLPVDAPPPLAGVIAKCLKKNPADRYSNASEIVRELAGPHRPFAPRAWLPRRLGLPAAVALLLILGALGLARLIARQPKIESVVVLPLQNLSGDPQQEYLADGMTDAIIDELARIRSLRVISRTSAMVYKGARKPLQQIANELSVDAVVEGSVASRGGRIRIGARLIRAAGERTLWTNAFERPIPDVLTLNSEVATALAREMRAALTPAEAARLSRKRTIDAEAYELYLKARYQMAHWNAEGFRNAVKSLEQAISRAPDFAEAHALLAGALANSALASESDPALVGPRAKAAARRAIELDDSLGESHYALGIVLQMFDIDYPAAWRELRRAVELSPNFSEGWAQLSNATLGTPESVEAAERAVHLDPVTPATTGRFGWALYYAHRFEESIAQDMKALELEPNAGIIYFQLAFAYVELGRTQEALDAIQRTNMGHPGTNSGGSWGDGCIAGLLAASGRRAEALAVIEPWEARAKNEYVEVYALAIARAQLGDREAAIKWLEEARRKRTPNFSPFSLGMDLRLKSMLGPLRGDPRVEAMTRLSP